MMDNLISYYGFSRTPFGRDLAPSMLHRHSAHNEAVARIGWCIAERRIGVITGEVGAGKTVAVLGLSFKEDVNDIRNSKVVDLVNELKLFSVKVEVVDPCASSEEVQHEYGFMLEEKISNGYDAVIAAVAHDQYRSLTEDYFLSITTPNATFIDVKGIFRKKILKMNYWSL